MMLETAIGRTRFQAKAGSFRKLARLFHTMRHLRPVQLYGRAWFLLHSPRPDLRLAPRAATPPYAWQVCSRPSSMSGPARFRFLNVERELNSVEDWNNRHWEKLWLYNLHYFDDLNAVGSDERHEWHDALIHRWVRENPPGLGVGWEPYCLSLRIVNWCKRHWRGGILADAAQHSLAVQARYLRKRIERHLLGNHLLANAKALIFAGAFFDGEEAVAWREHGLRLARRELREQVLPDGGHFERSPMYHSIILEDVFDLVQLGEKIPGVVGDCLAEWRELAGRMLRWLAVMTHPDGRIALFNDAAFDVAPEFAALCDYAAELGVDAPGPMEGPLIVLADSGYVRMARGRAVIIADVGEIGPAYLPGHAHADTLSFELSIDGQRVVVDAGTSRYDISADRLWERSAAAHNTVEIDGADSSEVWSSFRVARRAHPFDVAYGDSEESVWLSAAHDGYKRLPGRPVHRRKWTLGLDVLMVRDEIVGGYRRAISRVRLHPCWRVEEDIVGEGGKIAWEVSGSAGVSIVESSWRPEFGKAEPCCVIESALGGQTHEFIFRW
jgi:uncharacterized heparinase superfamily protein